MRRRAVLALIMVVLAAGPPQLNAQEATPAGDLRGELRDMRQSLDELVAVLRELQQQSAKRDAISALLHRIAAAEKGLAPLQEEARSSRQLKQKEEEKLDQAERSFLGLREMEKMDTAGSATEAFEAERGRLNGEVQQHQGVIAEVSQRLRLLEEDMAARQRFIDALNAQLDRLLTANDASRGRERAN